MSATHPTHLYWMKIRWQMRPANSLPTPGEPVWPDLTFNPSAPSRIFLEQMEKVPFFFKTWSKIIHPFTLGWWPVLYIKRTFFNGIKHWLALAQEQKSPSIHCSQGEVTICGETRCLVEVCACFSSLLLPWALCQSCFLTSNK